jgi:hypothetical protein
MRGAPRQRSLMALPLHLWVLPEGGVVSIQPDLREFRVRSPSASRTFPQCAYLNLAIVYLITHTRRQCCNRRETQARSGRTRRVRRGTIVATKKGTYSDFLLCFYRLLKL